MVIYTGAIEWARSEFPESRDTGHSSLPADANPETYVAALSRDHMRCFLQIAAMIGYIVDYYSDTPEASIARNSAGNPLAGHVVLQPAILFTGAKVPTEAAVLALHQAAHAKCPFANPGSIWVETLGVWHYAPRVDFD